MRDALDHLLAEADGKLGPVLSLAAYCQRLSAPPRPSLAQRRAFVTHVAGAHSWYKHLPLAGPGVAFTVFLDPFAGWERLMLPSGEAVMQIREEPGYHYSMLATAHYQQMSGLLAYASGARSKRNAVGIDDWFIAPRDWVAAVPAADGVLHRLPPEVIAAGTVHLTAAVHEHTGSFLDDADAPQQLALAGSPSNLADERERQRAQLLLAIDRVCELIS
ncbi:MAG: hypothetical protein V4650_00115 [Pseudomonadota bacterium]